jgi:hypothetical protein
MDLNSGQVITRNIVHEIPVTNVVIKAVQTMAYDQGFKSLKFKTRRGIVFFDTDWIAGVDYEEDDDNEEDESDPPYQYEAKDDESMECDNIDPEEVNDLNQDVRENHNPNLQRQNDNKNEDQPEHPEQEHGTMIVSDAEDKMSTATESTRRSTREIKPIKRLEQTMTGKLYAQQNKQVTFETNDYEQLEYCHNLVVQTKPDPNQSKEYTPQDAMLMARVIYDLNNKVEREGASFAQQYLLNKGLKVLGQKGHDASIREMDQLGRRSCFTQHPSRK